MPIYKNVSRRVAFQSLTTAGAANASTTPATQVSIDGAPFVNTTNLPVYVNNGCWQLILTSAELNGDLVALTATAAGCVPAEREFYPESDWTASRAPKLDNVDIAVSSRLASTSYSAAPTTTAIAAAILATPANPLSTDVSGHVTVAGYAAGQDPGSYLVLTGFSPSRVAGLDNLDAAVSSRLASTSYAAPPSIASIASSILVSPSNKLATDASGSVNLDLAQAVPLTNTAQSLGDALNAARAQGFGPWTLNANARTLTLYAADGSTVVRTFSLDSVTNPTTRT